MTADVVKPYLEALNTASDPDAMRAALKNTAPGSPAHAYLSHQANVAESQLDGGFAGTDTAVDDLGNGSFKSCEDPTDERSCATYAGFKVDSAGKLVDFTVNKQALGPRLTVGSGQSVRSAGNRFTFLTAYKTVAQGALFVTLKVDTGKKPISANLYSASYRSPDGKQRQASEAFGRYEIDAESNTVVTLIFPGVKPGGRVTLDGCVADCMTQFKAVMKVG